VWGKRLGQTAIVCVWVHMAVANCYIVCAVQSPLTNPLHTPSPDAAPVQVLFAWKRILKCVSLSRYVWGLVGELPFLFRVLLPWPDSQSVVGCDRDSRHTKVGGGTELFTWKTGDEVGSTCGNSSRAVSCSPEQCVDWKGQKFLLESVGTGGLYLSRLKIVANRCKVWGWEV